MGWTVLTVRALYKEVLKVRQTHRTNSCFLKERRKCEITVLESIGTNSFYIV